MELNELTRLSNESLDEFLYRLGKMKDSKQVCCTWEDVADLLNSESEMPYSESYWRKRYKGIALKTEPVSPQPEADTSFDDDVRESLLSMEKARIIVRDQNTAFRAKVRAQARAEDFMQELQERIERADPPVYQYAAAPEGGGDKVMHVLLSDLHYGLSFSNSYSRYNPDICIRSVMQYANEVVTYAKENHINTCVVSILGDMISGTIHQPIRLENSKNIIEQVIGVSDLVASFLMTLAEQFSHIDIYNVSGNHSRLEPNLENALRKERLDNIIPWYCKARLEKYKNIRFCDNEHEDTYAIFKILGKTYCCVHGDMDSDWQKSCAHISELFDERIDYFISAHMHVPEYRFGKTTFIRNGAIVPGGDDYTAKKRLYGDACQLFMICNERGVESIHPVVLKQ